MSRVPFLDQVLQPNEEPERFDTALAPGDLPYLLGQDLRDDIQPPIELTVQPARLAEMRGRLAEAGPPPYVGVTWRAGVGNSIWTQRLAPMDGIAAALDRIECTTIVLQRNPEQGEIAAFEHKLGRPAHDMTELNEDLEGMLALLSLLDEYVCVSNTNIALRSGASRVLAGFPPSFRWMLKGDESPWFPGSRIYRQTRDGRWHEPVRRLADDLSAAL